jgi:hypothetical protein
MIPLLEVMIRGGAAHDGSAGRVTIRIPRAQLAQTVLARIVVQVRPRPLPCPFNSPMSVIG